MEAHVAVRHGRLRLTTLALTPPPGVAATHVVVTLEGPTPGPSHPVPATHAPTPDGAVLITFAAPVTLPANHTLRVQIRAA